MQYTFPARRFVGTIGIVVRVNGVDRAVDAVRVFMDGRDLGTRRLAPGARNEIPVDAVGSVLRLVIAGVTQKGGENVGLTSVAISGVSVDRNRAALRLPALTDNGLRVRLGDKNPVRYEVDAVAAGVEAVPVGPVAFALVPGENSIGWSAAGIMSVGHIEVVGGDPASALLAPIAVRRISSVELAAKVAGPSLLGWSANGGGWSATVDGRPRDAVARESGFGPVWSVKGPGGTLVLRDRGAVLVGRWVKLQAAILLVAIVVMVVAHLWRRRRAARGGRA